MVNVPVAKPLCVVNDSINYSNNSAVNNPEIDVLPRAAFSTSGPDTLVNSDYVINNNESNRNTTGKRKREDRKEKALEKKLSVKKNLERNSNSKCETFKNVPEAKKDGEFSDFVELTKTYIKILVQKQEIMIAHLEEELCLILEKKNNLPEIPAHKQAKLNSVLNQKKNLLQHRLEVARLMENVVSGREIVIKYIDYFKNAETPDIRIAIAEDFKGRFCGFCIPVHRCNLMICPDCRIPMNIRGDDGFLVCTKCNTTQINCDQQHSTSNGEDADVHMVSAKREQNFRDFLHLLQGKKLNPLVEAKMPVIEQALGRLVQNWNVANLEFSKNLQDDIIDGLSAMGLRKFSKYVVLIEARLRGIPVVQIPLQSENRMCAMFLTIVDPYERNKPAHRKHFISYSYCAWQFCRIENLPQYFSYFRLLKDVKKIEQQDQIFQAICVEVGWKFDSPLRQVAWH